MRFALVAVASMVSLMVVAQDKRDAQPTRTIVPGIVAVTETPVDTASSPVIARALERRTMARKARVVDQVLVRDQVISQMSDGTRVTNQVKRATTARITPSGRDLRDAEIAALSKRLGADPADPRAVATALGKHQADLVTLETEATKSKGKAGAIGALAGLALGAAGAVGAKKLKL